MQQKINLERNFKMFDLKDFRENKLRMTQSEFANLLDMRQDAISRMEKNPEQMSLEVLKKIAERTGLTVDEVISYEKPKIEALTVENKWESASFVKKTLVNYISTKINDNSNYSIQIEELNDTVNNTIKKPKVVVAGRSDTGKSTLINAVIGKEKMPVNWTPTTSINVYIKHTDDRPNYIEEELWIFKKGENGEEWDDSLLRDEAYCRKWKIAGGSADMLNSYGTRHGDAYQTDEVGSAVIFVDSDVLKNCDIIDVPGFAGGVASDNEMAIKAKSKADILVYLSPAGSDFINSEDCCNLSEAINSLTILENSKERKLSNLFIVCSQAHQVRDPKAIKNKMDDGCERFYGTLTDNFWEKRKKITGYNYTIDDLRARFFSYTTDIPSLREDFEKALAEEIELLPSIIVENSKEIIKRKCQNSISQMDTVIEKYNSLLQDREECKDVLEKLENNEPARRSKFEVRIKDVVSLIDKISKESKEAFCSEYNRILSEEHIVSAIDIKKYKSKKEDMQLLSTFLNSELKDELERILQSNSEMLKTEVDSFISDFDSDCKIKNTNSQTFNLNSFNAQRAFASGIAGAATLGGLAIWASSLGNLGAYILVAKGVSLLSALGISISGGTAAAASAIASIGGPNLLGIALYVIAALGMFGVFSAGWKKRVAKKIKASYNEQNALPKYNKCIDEFWKDTNNAFEIAANKMESEWQMHIKDLRDTLNNYDAEELEEHIRKAEEIKAFFVNVPLQ